MGAQLLLSCVHCSFVHVVLLPGCHQQEAKEVIILEDDLKVSPDFFR